jgi:hypothetical protein
MTRLRQLLEEKIQNHWFLTHTGAFVIPGVILLALSSSKQFTFQDLRIQLPPGRVSLAAEILGSVLLLLGIGLGLRDFLDRSPIRVELLPSHEAIYREAQRMVEHCKGHGVIRATSISTGWPESDDPDYQCVLDFFKVLAAKCARAKREGKDLLYETILGFPAGTGGIPTPRKKKSVTERLRVFGHENARDRIRLMYLETEWSLDVLIVDREMIIGFPTLPKDRKFNLGLKIKDPEFVERVVNWYDHCVREGGRELTWDPETPDVAAAVSSSNPAAPSAAVPD